MNKKDKILRKCNILETITQDLKIRKANNIHILKKINKTINTFDSLYLSFKKDSYIFKNSEYHFVYLTDKKINKMIFLKYDKINKLITLCDNFQDSNYHYQIDMEYKKVNILNSFKINKLDIIIDQNNFNVRVNDDYKTLIIESNKNLFNVFISSVNDDLIKSKKEYKIKSKIKNEEDFPAEIFSILSNHFEYKENILKKLEEFNQNKLNLNFFKVNDIILY